jgi:hypothetical protein
MPFACLDPRIIVQERSELFFSSLSPTATCPSLINTDPLSLAAHYNDANQSDFPRLLKDIMLFLNTFRNVLDNVRHPRVAAQAPSRLSYHRLRAEETAPKRSSILTRAFKSVTNPLHWKPRPNKATFVNTRDGTTTPIATTSGHSKLLKIDSAIILTNCWNLNMNIQGYQLSEQPRANDDDHITSQAFQAISQEYSPPKSSPMGCPTPASEFAAQID